MGLSYKEEELQRLIAQIKEWNANRLDLFELSLPNENLEFYGVMRFFHQDEGSKVSTKCIRVSSTATTHDVLATLIEKFRPDMRMLTRGEYSLYEVHVNGEERKLEAMERPLFVQLNWGKDDREGRFLLKREDLKTVNLNVMMQQIGQSAAAPPAEEPQQFKRKLSKREKKELKKKEKEAKIKEQEKENVASKLYNEVPDTGFTRSISNPEAVMRRRRQQKLEKKLQQYKSKDGGPDTGGTLKIYGESLNPDVPYKTILLSITDTAAYVVKEVLEKYGLDKEDPNNYMLVQAVIPPGGSEFHGGQGWPGQRDIILDESECPLQILVQFPPSKGTIMFHIRRRPDTMPKKKKKKGPRGEMEEPGMPRYDGPEKLPFLVEVRNDLTEVPNGMRYTLPMNVTEVGSDKNMAIRGQHIQLYGNDIKPRHCLIAHTAGVVTVTPASKEALTYVDGQVIHDTTMLQHGMAVKFGNKHLYRFIDPTFEEKLMQPPSVERVPRGGPPPYDTNMETGNFETSFNLDGQVETVPSQEGMMSPPYGNIPPQIDDILPATLEFREDGEDAFLAAVISEVNGSAVQFKLGPTYTLYMATRFRISMAYRPKMSPEERADRLTSLVNKVSNLVQQTIQENKEDAVQLSFWMANASELLHFYKQDGDISRFSLDSQDILANAVQMAFRYLVNCMQTELHHTMLAFLNPSDFDMNDDDEFGGGYEHHRPNLKDVIQVLSSAMSLLRRCRVNAALTIQLFSQLFHFINMWLFNRLVLEPDLQLCTRAWGERLRRRLGRIEAWAEKQGLELAADCHLGRVIQAAHLLKEPKASRDDITNISSSCYKLNSLQLRALLQNYIPGPGEPHIPRDLIENVVGVAQSTADELTRSDGREVMLPEEPDLHLPFLLPEDGYSCDIIRYVPNGLAEFLKPLSQTGICHMTEQPLSSGSWVIYMLMDDSLQAAQPPRSEGAAQGMPKEPQVINITFNKVNGSMGLSIVAAKGEGQEKKGIYVKSVVQDGAAAQDGRLQTGDQLLEVDGKSLIGVTQEKAAELMMRTGQVVTLKVAKQGAIYHGLATLLSQPSPVMQRAANNRKSGGAGNKSPGPPRSQSEESMPFREGSPRSPAGKPAGPGGDFSPYKPNMQRPLQQQYGARSSPVLHGPRAQEPAGPPPEMYKQPPMASPGMYGSQEPPHPRDVSMRSKSTSNLDQPEKGMVGPGYQPSPSAGQPQLRHASQPDLQQPGYSRYDDYPHDRHSYQPNYVNQTELRNQSGYWPNQEQQPPYVKTSQSTPNIQADVFERNEPKPPVGMDHSRVHEWQQRNEMEQAKQQHRWQPDGLHAREEDDIPRGPQQPGYYNRPRETTPPYEQGPRPNDPMAKQPVVPKPSLAPKPGVKPKDIPKMQVDNRQSNFFEQPRGSQYAGQRDFPNQPQNPNTSQYLPTSQYQPTSPYTASAPYGSGPQYMPPTTVDDPRLAYSSPHDSYAPNQQKMLSPPGQPHPYDRRQQSPELPPPPDMLPEVPVPPPGPAEDLPPPPPPPAEYERLMQEEHLRKMAAGDPNRMRDRMDPQGADSYGYPDKPQSASFRGPSPMYMPQEPNRAVPPKPGGPVQHQQQPGYPGYMPPPTQSNYHNYQNLPPVQNRSYDMPPMGQAQNFGNKPDGQPGYGYRPNDSMVREGGPPRPDTKPPNKPQVNPKPDFKKPSSPWDREQREKLEKMKEEDLRRLRQQQIAELENKPQLTPDEHERLRRLRLDQEFEKRVAEAHGKEDEDSDTDITDRPAGRAQMLRMMQDDLEKKRQQKAEDKHQQQLQRDQAEAEKVERTERRLAMFEKERQEQKEREMKRQERREKEQEEILRKQRELRERQRQELEENQRQARLEEERKKEIQREELRKKKLAEQEHLRDLQLQREAEERNMRKSMLMNRPDERYMGYQPYGDRQEIPMGPEHIPPGAERIPPGPERMMPGPDRRDPRPSLDRRDPPGHNDHDRREPVPDRREQSPGLPYVPREAPPGLPYAPREAPSSSSIHHYGPPSEMPPSSAPQPYTSGGPMSASHTAPRDSYLSVQAAPYAPPPPERRSSYEVANQHGYRGSGQGPPTSEGYNWDRQGNNTPSAMRQIDTTPVTKKSVSFHDNIATEIRESTARFGSTSSDTSYNYQNNNGNPPGPSPFQRPNYGPPGHGSRSEEVFEVRTPENQSTASATLVPGPTPGVVGAQEVYRDPRDRIAAQKAAAGNSLQPNADRMSFRDKMKMFAAEAGEITPKEKPKISRAQRQIESIINGQ